MAEIGDWILKRAGHNCKVSFSKFGIGGNQAFKNNN